MMSQNQLHVEALNWAVDEWGDLYLAAAAVRSPPTTQRAFRQGYVLDDLRKVQVDLQQ